MNGPHRPTPTRRRPRPGTALAAATAALLLLAGCSSGSGGRAAENEGGDIAAGRADTEPLTIALVTHAADGDTFWDIVREGAEAAAGKDNVDLVLSSDPDPPVQATLVQNAIDQDVDGLAVTLAHPDALAGAVAAARDAGIPVVVLNSGQDAWREQGALAYFGQDETVAGRALGDRLNRDGAGHAVCVVHEQGNVALEARCAGVADTFAGETEILYVEGADMPSVKATIEARLRQDPSIDRVVTLGAPFALTAVLSAADAGSAARVATFDLNADLVRAIRDGDVAFAVDQQPFLQGYLAVDTLWLYRVNGNFPGGGTAPVLTGPAFVDRDNVETVARYAEAGTR
jgi:simple sugar transport system substrate-binding protein